MKCEGLIILGPHLLVERAYNTPKADIEVLVGSFLGGTDLNYVAHKGCVHRASADECKQRDLAEKAVLSRQKEQADRDGTKLPLAVNGEWGVDHSYTSLP